MIRRQPLLLLGALLCDGQLWADQIERLADVSRPMIGDLTQDDSVAGMAERALGRLTRPTAIAGVGLGGYVALEMLRQAPERVSRLALFGTRGTRDRRLRVVSEHGALSTAPHADPSLTPIIAGKAQAMAERIGVEVFARQQRALLTRPEQSDVLRSVDIPALIMVGDRDRICTPADAAVLCGDGARVRVLAGCGHLAPLERPGEVAVILREWLLSASSEIPMFAAA